jgi:hypothetical protein
VVLKAVTTQGVHEPGHGDPESEPFRPQSDRIDIMVRRTAIALVALFTLTVTSNAVLAHEGHDHKIMGTVTMAAADHVMLKDKDAKDVMVKVTKDTRVKSTPAMKVEEIKAGTRVVITATEAKDKSYTARSIEVGIAAAVTK